MIADIEEDMMTTPGEEIKINQKVFTGTYWDEFALAPLHCEIRRPNVLFLGTATVSSLRPIFSVKPKARMTVVQKSECGIKHTKNYFKEYFPKTKIHYFLEDPYEFLKKNSVKFDLIYVDLYEEMNYAPIVFEDDFWLKISASLNKRGIVSVNIYGLPCHLQPLKSGSVQRSYFEAIARQLNVTAIYPFKKNLTIIGNQGCIETFQKKVENKELKRVDQVILYLFQKRVLFSKMLGDTKKFLGVDEIQKKDVSTVFELSKLDHQIKTQWKKILQTIQNTSCLENKKFLLMSKTELQSFLKKSELKVKILEELLEIETQAAVALLQLIWSEAQRQDESVFEFFDWFIKSFEDLLKNHPFVFSKFILPQCISFLTKDFVEENIPVLMLKEKIQRI